MGSSCGVCTACKQTETALNSSTETKHDQIIKQTGDQGVRTTCKQTETALNSSTETKHDQIIKQTGDQGVRTTCKQTETASNTSTDDTPQTQTQHDQGVVLCVWGFILIHMESTQPFQSNNVIPEAIKQLIVNFMGKHSLFLKMINDSEHKQIELKVHSHKGHYKQY
eukprot:161618_1